MQTGNTLTISSTVAFGPDAALIIKQGAKVVVDGGTLTNYKFCGYENFQWKGVQVWGDETQHQYTINGQNAQGQLELINGATIENAVCAVELWKPSDYSTTGGIVVADSAFFINNAKSVHGLFYTNYNPGNPNIKLPNKSSFINCVFEINHNYIPSNTFYKHIDLAEVNGFEFYGCDFSCENSSGVSSATMGIASYGSGFGVHSRCSSICTPCPQANIDRSTFTGFYQGIYQTNEKVYPFVVDDAVFSDNEYGINVNSTDHFVVLNSTFNIGQNVNDTESCTSIGLVPSGYGIYSEASTGFIIEDNTFTKQQGAPPNIYTGICIDNAEGIDEITNNSFDHLYHGNLTKHLNYKDLQATEGLCYYCNNNTYNVFDFRVMGDTIDPSGIQSTQGSIYMAAGNTFSPTALWHFHNDGIPHIGYYSYAPGSLEDPDELKLYRVTDHENNPQNPCTGHYNSAKSTDPDSYNLVLSQAQLDSALDGFVENEMNLNTVSQLYESLEDGGDTPATLTDIETAIPIEMWDLRTELLGKSPHLSNEALKKITDRTDVFPDDVLLEILMSNPDELRNKKLIEYIENSPDPLPDYMIDILKQAAASSNTYKTFLNQQKSFYGTKRVRHANDIIRSILFDTTINMNSYRNWLDNVGGEKSDISIIESYLHEGNYTDAILLASTLPVVYNYNEQQLIEHNYFLDMIEFRMLLDSTNRNMMMLDSTELSYLNNIAENSLGRAGVEAKGILKALYGYTYCNCVDVDSSLHLKYSNASMPVMKSPVDFSITISPNPASTWTNIEYTLPIDCHRADLMIFDQYGREVEILQLSEKRSNIVWDIRTLEKGVYIYKVSHGETTLSGKIIIN